MVGYVEHNLPTSLSLVKILKHFSNSIVNNRRHIVGSLSIVQRNTAQINLIDLECNLYFFSRIIRPFLDVSFFFFFTISMEKGWYGMEEVDHFDFFENRKRLGGEILCESDWNEGWNVLNNAPWNFWNCYGENATFFFLSLSSRRTFRLVSSNESILFLFLFPHRWKIVEAITFRDTG